MPESEYDDGLFDEDVAARYDRTSNRMFEPEVLGPAVEFLAALAGSGRALEFGIGTGRVALPLEVFRNAATHLGTGGRFVVEVNVPRLRQLPPGETTLLFSTSDDHWGYDEYDVARIAGLELEARWADWRRSPFTAESTSHVSVWRKP